MLSLKLQNLSLSQPKHVVRLAVVGIGRELNGDEAAGVIAARKLRGLESRQLRVVDAGATPDNVTGLLGQFQPALVLLIVAVQLNKFPGTIRWFDWRDTIGLDAPPQLLPPYAIARCFVDDVGCEVALIAIQPRDNSSGAPLSADVHSAVNEIVAALQAALPVVEPTA